MSTFVSQQTCGVWARSSTVRLRGGHSNSLWTRTLPPLSFRACRCRRAFHCGVFDFASLDAAWILLAYIILVMRKSRVLTDDDRVLIGLSNYRRSDSGCRKL